MTRRKGILKIISAVLAVLLLAVFFAGCGEYKPPVNDNTGGNSAVRPKPDDPPENPPDDPDEENFTVKLTHYDGSSFTSADSAEITAQRAQWTEINQVRPKIFRAYFNAEGIATAPDGLDGDYKVTLILTASFNRVYCYDPNPARAERRNELNATNVKKDVSVPLYELKPLGDAGQIAILSGPTVSYYTLTETGAYSYTLKSKDDAQMFCYMPKATEDHSASGEYSFMTLMDVTDDKINPKVDVYAGHLGNFVTPKQADYLPAAEGNYTKNVWLKYFVAEEETGGTNCLGLNLHSESEKPGAYPLTIYFIFERDGEFTSVYDAAEKVPVTEDFSNTPAKPSGSFMFCAQYYNTRLRPAGSSLRNILNDSAVKLNAEDGYYYYINPATGDFYRGTDGNVLAQYRLYAKISAGNEVHRESFTYSLLFRELSYVCEKVGKPAYNYQPFVTAYAAHCNQDGAYPVNEELKTFLQRRAVAQRYFNDGYGGYAEQSTDGGPGYNSDEKSQWMYACGVYVLP